MATPAFSPELEASLRQLLEGFKADMATTIDRAINRAFDKAFHHLPQTSPPAQPAPPPSAPLAAPPQASPPAQQPCASTPPELPPQPPTPVPSPAPARSYPPSPSVETIEEVEHKQVYKIPLRNIKQMKQMRQKLNTAKKVPTSETPAFEKCFGWPPKFGGIDMRFSRDEEPDAWYTTMLNAIDALPHRT